MKIPFPSLFTKAIIIAIVCAAGFAGMAWLVGERKIAAFDSYVIARIQGMESARLTGTMKFFTTIGAGIPAIMITFVIVVILYAFMGYRRELILFFGVAAGSALLNGALKQLFRRARPTIHRIAEATGYSFPSGHSMAAFSLYGILAFLLWKKMETAFARTVLLFVSVSLILAIGVSRIYLGVHYPSDVIGGYLASGSWLAACIWLYQRYAERSSNR